MSGTTHRCACQSSYHVAACPGSPAACGGFSAPAYPDCPELMVPASEVSPDVEESTVAGRLPASED